MINDMFILRRSKHDKVMTPRLCYLGVENMEIQGWISKRMTRQQTKQNPK